MSVTFHLLGEQISDASLGAGVRVHDILLQNTIKVAEESWHRVLDLSAE